MRAQFGDPFDERCATTLVLMRPKSAPTIAMRHDSSRTCPTVANLQALVREAVERLKASERDAKMYRALWHMLIQPVAPQDRCAGATLPPVQHVSVSAYARDRPGRGWLWHGEVHGMDS